jgi:hypothetical protein
MSEEKHDRPRHEASDPGREPAPGDEVEPGTQGRPRTFAPSAADQAVSTTTRAAQTAMARA